MSSKTISVPKYRHHKGSGQAFVQVNGRRHYLGRWNTQATEERYAAFVAKLAVCPTSLPLTTPASAITVVELAAAYLDFAEGYYQKDGQRTRSLDNIKRAIRVVKDLYGREPVATFSPLCLLAIQEKLVATRCARSYGSFHKFCNTPSEEDAA